MCRDLLVPLLVLGIVSFVSANLVPFITPCKKGDIACATQSADKAIPVFASGHPKYGVENLKSVHFDKVDCSSKTLKLILSDITITDLEKCHALTVDTSVPNKIHLKLLCTVEVNGQYEMEGQLLSFLNSASGKGKIHVDLRKAEFDLHLEMVTKSGSDGEDHWHVKKFHHQYKLNDKSDVEFENLTDVNTDLGKAAHELIASNGNAIIEGIGGPMIVATITRLMKNVNNLFSAAPLSAFIN